MFKNKTKIIAFFLVLFLLFSSTFVFADDEVSQDNEIMPISDESVENAVENTKTQEDSYKKSDVYLTGDNITIDYIVDGNLFVVANTVTINSQIGGDAFICAKNVIINKDGYVFSNLFTTAESVEIKGVVYDVFALAKNFTISGGFVYRDLKVACGNLTVNGSVGRNAFVACSSINFNTDQNSNGIIYGDLNYSSDPEVSIPENSVKGNVNYTNLDSSSEQKTVASIIAAYIINLGKFLAFVLIIWLICLALAPKFLANTNNYVGKKTLGIFGYGLLSLIVVPIACIILVLLIMILMYHFSGFIAGTALVVYTMLSFLVFYLIEGTLTLPGIAAMLLGIGMAVDASVISFERIKDQLKIGKPLKEAVAIGNKESLSSILDANITTMIVAVILFILGQSSVKGFATMLIINILLTIIVLVFISKAVVALFAGSGVFDNKVNLFIGLSKKKIIPAKEVRIPFKKLDFVKSRKIVLPIVLLALVGGITYSLITHFNFAVDFTGGTSITINTTDDISLGDYTINKIDRTKDSTNIVINEKLTKEEIEALSNKLEEEYHTTSNIYVVSDMVKKQLIKNAIMAVIISLIGIIIYVSFRFRFNYAISGIVALMHDALITIIFFGVFKLQIDSVFIAAILTIIGYSINDTIVTFDMIRRNYNERKIKNKDDLPELVNDSVRLTFFRSLMTTATTIVPIICLIVLGSHEILNFNIALLIGFIAGVFSSIYISNSLWLMLESKRLSKPKKEVKKKVEKEEMQIKGINC